jgi:LPXTG-motif cell wall-anchored protein
MRKLIVVLGGIALALGAATAAGAQTYPTGSTTPTTAGNTSGSINAGTLGSGGTVSVDVCGFAPGSTVTITLNGGAVTTATVGSNGCATITIQVVSPGTALGRPVFAAAGLQLAQTSSSLKINGVAATGLPPGQQNTIGATGTGSNLATRTVNVFFTTSTSATSGSGLPRTGVMILRWALAALGLIAIGALLVVADRRRNRKSADI